MKKVSLKRIFSLTMTMLIVMSAMAVTMPVSAATVTVPVTYTDDFTSYTTDDGKTYDQTDTTQYSDTVSYTGVSPRTANFAATAVAEGPVGKYYLSSTNQTSALTYAYVDTESDGLMLKNVTEDSWHFIVNLNSDNIEMDKLTGVKVKYKINTPVTTKCSGFRLFVNGDNDSYYYFCANNGSGHNAHGVTANKVLVTKVASGTETIVSQDTSWENGGSTSQLNYAWDVSISDTEEGTKISWTVSATYDSGASFDSGSGSFIADTNLINKYTYPVSLVNGGYSGVSFREISLTGEKQVEVLGKTVTDDFTTYTDDEATYTETDTGAYSGSNYTGLTTKKEIHPDYATTPIASGPIGKYYLSAKNADTVKNYSYVDTANDGLFLNYWADEQNHGIVNLSLNEKLKSISGIKVTYNTSIGGTPTACAGVRLFVNSDEDTYYTFGGSIKGNHNGAHSGVTNNMAFVSKTVGGTETVLDTGWSTSGITNELVYEWEFTISDEADGSKKISWTVNMNKASDGVNLYTWTDSLTDTDGIISDNYAYPVAMFSSGNPGTRVNSISITGSTNANYEVTEDADGNYALAIIPSAYTSAPDVISVIVATYTNNEMVLENAVVELITADDLSNGVAYKTFAKTTKEGATQKMFIIKGDLTDSLTPLERAIILN